VTWPLPHLQDKGTGQNAGYGFVRFSDRQSATLALNYLQSKVFYAQELKVNWAFQSHQREDTSTHWQVGTGR
jgi:RNA recognition motif-containing protein